MIIEQSTADLTLVFILTVTLVYGAYRDIKYRDIPEVTWVPAIAAGITLNLMTGRFDIMHTLISLIPAIMLLILAFLGMMGGADFLAILTIGVVHPYFTLLPISLLTLGYSLIIPIFLMIYYLLRNVSMKNTLQRIRCVEGRRTYLWFLGYPLRISEFLKRKFVYPLTIPAEGGYICRSSFGEDEEEEKVRNTIVEKIKEGSLTPTDIIWVTPGLPHVVFFLIGYLLALVTPQNLLLSMLLH